MCYIYLYLFGVGVKRQHTAFTTSQEKFNFTASNAIDVGSTSDSTDKRLVKAHGKKRPVSITPWALDTGNWVSLVGLNLLAQGTFYDGHPMLG